MPNRAEIHSSFVLQPAGPYAELCLHGLTFLDVAPDPSTLFDPRYHAWVRALLGDACVDPLAADAPLMARLYRAEGERARALHGLPLLHRDIAEFRATASRPFGAVRAEHVRDAAVLATLRPLEPALVELLRGALLLAAPSFARGYDTVLAPWLADACDALAPFFAQAAAVYPPLRALRVHVSTALGAHGRLLDHAIYVGAPLAWHGLDASWCVLQALHEAAVFTQPAPRSYLRVEWGALTTLAKALDPEAAAAPPAWLVDAHCSWLSAHALAPLCTAACAEGLVDALNADRIAHGSPIERAEALRRISV